jgi:hypothetical protein
MNAVHLSDAKLILNTGKEQRLGGGEGEEGERAGNAGELKEVVERKRGMWWERRRRLRQDKYATSKRRQGARLFRSISFFLNRLLHYLRRITKLT